MISFWRGFEKQSEKTKQQEPEGQIPKPSGPGDVFHIGDDGRMVKTPIPEASPELPQSSPKVPPKSPASPPPGQEKEAANTSFQDGFQKVKDGVSSLPKALAAPAAAAGTYLALRRPGSRRTLSTIVSAPKKGAPSLKRKITDKILYGTDKPLYVKDGATLPSKAKKVKGTVLHPSSDDKFFFKGDKNIGDISGSSHMKKLDTDKGYEATFIKKHSPSHAIRTGVLSAKHKGKSGIKNLHSSFSNKGYLIKPTGGFGSGVGGGNFVSSKDVEKFLSGKRLNASKTKKIRRLIKNPKGNIIQEDIGIAKSPVTRKNSEFRVHAIGGKVVRKGGVVRAGNVEESYKIRNAEKHFQKFLDKLPADKKNKNIFWAPDVARTSDGSYKIIELNAGTAASGLIDPRYLKAKHKGIKGQLAAAGAVKINNKIYKSVTGRSTSHDAATKALGVAGVTEAIRRSKSKAERK